MMGLVGVAASVGCMRWSVLRTSAGSVPEVSPTGALVPVAGGATPGASWPAPANAGDSWGRNATTPPPGGPSVAPAPNPDRTAASPAQAGPAASPAPGGTGPVEASAPGDPSSASPVPAGELLAPPTSVPTPLLDAEIRRAQTVNRQHIESLKAADTPTPVVTPVDPSTVRSATAPGPAAAEPRPADIDPEVFAPLPLAASPRTAVEPEKAGSPGGTVVPLFMPIDPPPAGSAPPATTLPPGSPATDSPGSLPDRVAVIVDAREADRREDESMPTRSESGDPDAPKIVVQQIGGGPATSAEPPAQADREEHPPLEVAALRLCSKVKGFGSFEPVNPEALQPGQRVRVYCEMAGLEYQARGDAFVSRLAAHLELRSGTDGPVVWEQAPEIAKDLCHRPRRDYYVSYLVEFPKSLEPGPYRLRLIQTDLVGNRAASSEIPVTIAR
jgi:hypothetical protein